MNLQKKLIQLSEYKCSFKYVDSYFLVSMTYPESWSIIPSEDRTIEVAEEDGVTFYAAPIETDIENAFVLIDDTISYNLDVEKKMALLKYNIGKLQELFAEKDLEELETIEFVFKQKQTKKTTDRKQVQKKNTKKKAEKTKEYKTTEPQIDTTIHTEEDIDLSMPTDYSVEDNICLVNETQEETNNKYLEEVER